MMVSSGNGYIASAPFRGAGETSSFSGTQITVPFFANFFINVRPSQILL